jgi:hypothetical protein
MLKKYKFLIGAALLSLGAAIFAQGPVGNTVFVKLDRDTIVGSQTIPAGDYTIREVTSASNPRVLEFTTDRGTNLAATVTAIPLLQNTPPGETKVVLDTESSQPRISKIWVQGKDYGYEFPKEFSFAQPLTVAEMQLRYEVPNSNAAQAGNTPAQPTAVAQAPPAAQAPKTQTQAQQTPEQPAQVAQAPQTPSQTQNPVTPAPQSTQTPPAAQVPQSTQTPPTAQAPQTAQTSPAAQAPQTAQTPTTQNAPAAEGLQSTDTRIPATGLGWADLLLISLVCASAGLFLIKRTA